jgi:hypothetical protein
LSLYKTNYPDGFISIATPSIVSVVGIVIEQFTLSGTDISNGYITLSGIPALVSTIALDWNGVDQYYSTDYTVSLNIVNFSGSLLSNLGVGDKVKISYQ